MDEKKIVKEEEVVEDAAVEEDDSSEETPKESFIKSLIGKDVFYFSTRDICEIAILCALAIVFDQFCKIEVGALGGGSINFAMFPLFIIALRHGWFKGFISGAIIFGLITCAIDANSGSFLAYPLDYFIGFGSVGVVGVFRKLITHDDYNVTWHSYAFATVAALAAYLVRFIAATLDGMILYGENFVGSVVYNSTYLWPSFITCLALFLGLLVVIVRTFRTHNTKSL